MARKVFFSFHYVPDNWRASTVRNIGALEGNSPASDNDWETVKRGGDDAIKRWIKSQMSGRTCCLVLVGAGTADRKWINHEISEAWNAGLGVAGICIHGLKDRNQMTSAMGNNPFDFVTFKNTGKKLSSVVKCYNPSGATSQERYDWIKKNLAAVVEEAITIRNGN